MLQLAKGTDVGKCIPIQSAVLTAVRKKNIWYQLNLKGFPVWKKIICEHVCSSAWTLNHTEKSSQFLEFLWKHISVNSRTMIHHADF